MNLNSSEVRIAARRAQAAAIETASVWQSSLKGTMADVAGGLRGQTASALQNVTNNLGGTIMNAASQLEEIATELFMYANHLDWLDRQAKEEINRI